MSAPCLECKRLVRRRRVDGRFVWHRQVRSGRKWCPASPGYRPKSEKARPVDKPAEDRL